MVLGPWSWSLVLVLQDHPELYELRNKGKQGNRKGQKDRKGQEDRVGKENPKVPDAREISITPHAFLNPFFLWRPPSAARI